MHPAPCNRGLNQGCLEKFMTNFTDLDTQMKCCEVEILSDFSTNLRIPFNRDLDCIKRQLFRGTSEHFAS